MKDKYPAYIDWETFERIQAMLRDNHAEYLRTKARGMPRDGAALLHGIAWCGECGHKMAVQYKGGSHTSATTCGSSTARRCASACRPPPIDARGRSPRSSRPSRRPSSRPGAVPRERERQADEALRRAEAQQVERLRYQAALAERQFNQVDPDNRLVAAELERRWEAALRELRQAEDGAGTRTAAARTLSLGTIDRRLRARSCASAGGCRSSGPTRRQPGAQEGAAALPDRQGGAAPRAGPRRACGSSGAAGRRASSR